jgi:hypothetical protein
MVGFFLEVSPPLKLLYSFSFRLEQNGPIRIATNGTVSANKYSWDKVADYIWIDQPVFVLSIP